MARSKFGGLSVVLGAVAAGAAGFFAIHYLLSGTREKSAVLIPDSVERRLDIAVRWLDQQFGRQWVDRGLAVIRGALSQAMPGVAALAEVVYQAELLGRQHRWTGHQKRRHAMRHAL